MRVLEIGASSMLDHAIPEGIIWDKIYNHHKPLNYSNLYEMGSLPKDEYDVYIFSLGKRDAVDATMNTPDPIDVWKILDCQDNFVKYFMQLTEHPSKIKSKMILIGSDSASEDVTYASRPYYAAFKSYQSSLFKNYKLIDKSRTYIEIRFGSVITRMCNHGMGSLAAFNRVLSYL